MPLIANSKLPAFERLREEGETVLTKDRATHQAIRELHVGLLNLMPDAALEATERQFFRLVGRANQIAQFCLHPFTLPSIERSDESKKHISKYYKDFEDIKSQGLDALIVTGAPVEQANLSEEPFYEDLKDVIDWSYNNVTSTICSCLATHAVMEFRYDKKRQSIGEKCWGVFPHEVIARQHPILKGINTRFDVPHSRFNEISLKQFKDAGVEVLVKGDVGAHMCVSDDLFRIVLFQGHPEYDSISLLKEYKREVSSFLVGNRSDYPVFPDNYLNEQSKAILREFKSKLLSSEFTIADFPESLIANTLDNTWRDAAGAIISNWIGCVYQVTHEDIDKLFMDGINPEDPLGIK
ncbi:MAG TPA: homoserine O-succinyltransferase [Gammaproteobacteria bacterium]|jgi:homoserine O-succinyltransferase|nr:homoserine O-succinyltransferase [Gammaproteobacteria bacterium]HAY40755.1 homoserine O-succinyltransferase [Gammaproteobacteria bacterium]|tara:strand:- start:2340 stop:3395 length:1056 start_codon:yes stop_codon:yes gene_type:complete